MRSVQLLLFVSTTLILWGTICRLYGNDPVRPPHLGRRRVELRVAEPISVSQRWPQYCQNRRSAIDHLTQELQQTLRDLIQEA